PRSGPAAFPPHPDDDAGGVVRCVAADAVDRHRRRTAPAAGPGHGGRAAAQPGAYAVYHAGHLPDVRPPFAPGQGAAGRGAGMILSAPFIVRPVATVLLCLGLVLAGLLSYRMLPVAPLPEVDLPIISVTANLPGASPETMASSVATPLERSLGAIAGVTEMTSRSSQGSTRITLQFDLSRDIDGAARDVQAAINAARSLLPTGLRSNPTYRKVNPSSAPIMVLAMTSNTLSQGRLYDLASTIVAQKLAQVKGVGEVTVGGSSLPAVRVNLNPGALSSRGVSLDEVRSTLTEANANRPKGFIENDSHHWQIMASDQLERAEQYRPLVVAWRDGAPVRLSDVATVEDSVEDLFQTGFYNNSPAILL